MGESAWQFRGRLEQLAGVLGLAFVGHDAREVVGDIGSCADTRDRGAEFLIGLITLAGAVERPAQGGQDFVRVYSERVYGIPPEQVVGSVGGVNFQYTDGRPELFKEPKLLLNDDNAGKPEAIHMMIGRRPIFAFGNSTGDR